MTWEKKETQRLLKKWIEDGGNRSAILHAIHSVLKEWRVTLKKPLPKIRGYSGLWDYTDYYLSEFMRLYNKDKNFDAAAKRFLNRFKWAEVSSGTIYTSYPSLRNFDYQNIPTKDDLNNIPAHFTSVDRERLASEALLSLHCKKAAFEEHHNPISALEALFITHEEGLYPPLWVIDFMVRVFREYYDSNGSKNLEQLFGFKKGKGQSTAFQKEFEEYRDDITSRDIYLLCTFGGFTLDEACMMVAGKLSKSATFDAVGVKRTLSPETIKSKWEKKWRELHSQIASSKYPDGHVLKDELKKWWDKNHEAFLNTFPKSP